MQRWEMSRESARELRNLRVRRYLAASIARGLVVERDGTTIRTNEFSGELRVCR